MFRTICAGLLGALALAGCAKSIPLRSTPDLTVTQDTALPAPQRIRAGYLGPLDKVRVAVFGVPDLTLDETAVDAAGNLTVPLVGAINVNGRTPAEVARLIETGLRGKYVRNPQVTVSLTDPVSQTVTVDGAVERPGAYPVTNRTTLMRAIALGGGLNEFAKIDDVVILRQVDDRRMAGLYNIGQIRRGAYEDPAIYPDDVVIVGDSPARRAFRNLLQVAPLAVAPLVAVLSRSNN